MPTFSRALLFSVQATALVASVRQAPLNVFAAPLPAPAPMPIPPHLADYASQPPSRTNGTIVPHAQVLSAARRAEDVAVVTHTSSTNSGMARRQAPDMSALVPNLQTQASLLRTLSTANGGGGTDSISALLNSILDLLTSMTSYQSLLAQAAADKGLMNYDQNNPTEAALKDIVNTIKYTLNDLVAAMDGIDALGLGPILGRVVYIIKCIIDAVLDTSENFVDGVINKGVLQELQEELQQLLTVAQNTNCALGLPLLGIVCV